MSLLTLLVVCSGLYIADDVGRPVDVLMVSMSSLLLVLLLLWRMSCALYCVAGVVGDDMDSVVVNVVVVLVVVRVACCYRGCCRSLVFL